MMIVTKDATDVTSYFHLRLAADGTDATGLTVTNMDLQYCRSGATPAAKVDASALGAANSAHADNSAIEVDATDTPGLYRVDWPDAAFATGVDEVILTVKVATAFTESLRVRLISATRGLAGTALPNAAADAAGGLPISDAGGLDLDAQIGTDIDAILVDTAEIGAAGAGLTNINLPNQTMDIVGNITGNLSGSVGSVTATVSADVVSVSGDSTAADNLETAFDDTAGAVRWTNIVDQGTAQSAGATTLVLRSAAAFANDEIIGARILITGGSSGVGQSRLITDYVSSTDTATVDTWTTTPTGTITYKIFSETGALAPGAIMTTSFTAGAIDAAAIAANAIGSSELADGCITAAKIATDAIDADALADSAITAATFAAGAITATVIATDAIDADALADGAITAATFASGAIDATALAANAVDEILDDTIGDGTITVRQALRILIAGMAGKLSGAATTTVTIRNLADSADVVVATVDADGNRSAVTVTP